jgi:hypothetical protein
MCNCCDACRARGASEAKNRAATAIGKALGNVPIDGSTPSDRFADAIKLVQEKLRLTRPKALGRALKRHSYLQQRSF